MQDYDKDSKNTRFTDTSYLYVNQVTGDDDAAWEQNPSPASGYNSTRFKTIAGAFRYAAARGTTNITLYLEINPSKANSSTGREYFHVFLDKPLTITSCRINVLSGIAKNTSPDPSKTYKAGILFDYANANAYFLRLFMTYVELSKNVSVGLSEPRDVQGFAQDPAAYANKDNYSDGRFLEKVDKFRGTTHLAQFHGIGMFAAKGSEVWFKVDGQNHGATLWTELDDGVRILRPAVLKFGGNLLPPPRGINKKNYLELNGNASVQTITRRRWFDCTKSSNWHGAGASWRLMNLLSPNMPQKTFDSYLTWMVKQKVDHANVFLTNKADGTIKNGKALYCNFSIYGSNFKYPTVNTKYVNTMETRMNTILSKGLSIVFWMMADDSDAWSNKLKDSAKFERYCKDVKALGWFDKASAVVVGLEVDEYWSPEVVQTNVAILKRISGLPVGVHLGSISLYDAQTAVDNPNSPLHLFFDCADLIYLQVNPPTVKKPDVPCSTEEMVALIQLLKMRLNKPICMFESERFESRERSQAALNAGAYSVGNW